MVELAFLNLLGSFAPIAALSQWMRMLPLWSTVVAMVAPPAPPPPPPLGPMAHLYQWMRALPLWSTAADVVADTRIPRPLLIYFVVVVVVIVGLMLLLPSRSGPLPRRSRRAPKRWYGSDAGVLAAKRGEKPPSGARIGGGSGGGGTSSTITSGGDEPPAASDPPRAAAPAISISEPIPALLAAFSIVHTIASMLLKRAPTVKLFFVCGLLLASVAVAVEATDRRLYSPRRKAGGAAQEHAIDVARPSDHQMEREETVGEHIRWTPRSVMH